MSGDGGVLGVVPVGNTRGDGGPSALWELAGTPLVRTAVEALVGSGAVHRVVVTAPAGLRSAVTTAVGPIDPGEPGDAPGPPVLVVGVADPGPAAVRVALDRAGSPLDPPGTDRSRTDRVVVVLAPEIVTTPDAVRRVVDALDSGGDPAGGAAGALTVCAVTDTLKTVGPEGVVLGTADRERYLALAGPQAYREAPLLAALSAAGDRSLLPTDDPDTTDLVADLLPGYLLRTGAPLVTVEVVPGVRRITRAADLVLAEAAHRAVAPANTRAANGRSRG